MVTQEYVDGFVQKLAEAGVTLDQAENFVFGKKAYDVKADSVESILNNKRYSGGQYKDPVFSRNLYERVYSKTRNKLNREANRAQAGRLSLVWQGLRNPVTGKWRVPISLGSKKINTTVATMTPAQANLVALLSKHKKLKNFNQVQRKVNRRSGDFEFMGDPTIFNARASKLTNRGIEDFKKAYKYVHGFEPDNEMVEMITNRLFGTHAGFDGAPHVFERYTGRGI